jgi:hypothetical protein
MRCMLDESLAAELNDVERPQHVILLYDPAALPAWREIEIGLLISAHPELDRKSMTLHLMMCVLIWRS